MRAGENVKLWPNILGAKNWQHATFNPDTGLLYANTMHMWSTMKLADLPNPHKPGDRWMGVQDIKIDFEPNEPHGHMSAIDPMTGKTQWSVPLNDHAKWSSMQATKGGLLFTGRHTSEFMELDADNGKRLLQFQTSSVVNANPVT